MFQTFLHQTNYLAILVSGLLVFGLGALWYSPIAFVKPWMESIGKSQEELRAGSKSYYLFTLICILIYCFVLAFIVWFLGTSNLMGAIKVGLFFGGGFVFTTYSINSMFALRPVKLIFIDAGYHVTGIVIATIILSLWK